MSENMQDLLKKKNKKNVGMIVQEADTGLLCSKLALVTMRNHLKVNTGQKQGCDNNADHFGL